MRNQSGSSSDCALAVFRNNVLNVFLQNVFSCIFRGI
jgi:hypothetical protein